jgi:hypothetical protein
MNERIKKLIEQATTTEKGAPNWDYTANIVITTFDKEKFAELIVRECARFVHKAQPNGLALDVLEHFGVE